MRFRHLIALATVAAASLAACGGGGENVPRANDLSAASAGPGESIRRLRAARDDTVAVGSLDVVMTFETSMNGRESGFTTVGVTDPATGAGRFEIQNQVPGQTTKAVTDGELFWIAMDEQPWIEFEFVNLPGSANAHLDPTEWLSLLDEAGDVTDEGVDEVNGVSATRYHADLDFASFVEALGVDLDSLEGDRRAIDAIAVEVDVWIDGDNVIRQTQITMEASVRDTEVSVSLDIDISPADEPVVVDGPPPGEIVDGGRVDFNDVVAGS